MAAMDYDKDFARICAWLQSRGYTAHTFNAYEGAKGKAWAELRWKQTRRLIRRFSLGRN